MVTHDRVIRDNRMRGISPGLVAGGAGWTGVPTGLVAGRVGVAGILGAVGLVAGRAGMPGISLRLEVSAKWRGGGAGVRRLGGPGGRAPGSRGPWDAADVRGAAPTLVLCASAGIAIYRASGLGPVAVVVPLSTVDPIVAILFRRYWMEEEMTRAQKFAVGLALVGAALVSL